ncbi:MAG: 6-pyruvoyl tetrahydropterin synthase family protein [Pirellulales bacterium]|nr:6-pyruvoyl tetrahydropterin synthase family protein [Pirellulales bacterium]
MSETFRVRIHKERLVFSAAHFITFAGNVCEPLHGHNYRVYAEIHGPLDENHYVIDFILLRDALQRIVDALDHRMLLPTDHPAIRVEETAGGEAGEVTVTYGRRRWVFPRQDCVLLPVANTTAELIARYIATELRASLGETLDSACDQLEVGVDECDGQWGVYRWTRKE